MLFRSLFGGFGTGISKRTTRSRYATEVTEASTAQDEAGAGATTRARWASACGKAKEWPQSSAEAPETFPRRATTVTGDFGGKELIIFEFLLLLIRNQHQTCVKFTFCSARKRRFWICVHHF